MRFAVLNAAGDLVENVVVARENQREELEAALGRTLVDAAPLGLLPGDLKTGDAWTRNVGGEQTTLPIETASEDVEQALRILLGEVE